MPDPTDRTYEIEPLAAIPDRYRVVAVLANGTRLPIEGLPPLSETGARDMAAFLGTPREER